MASSSIIIGAFFKIALAMEIRCFSPPDSDLPVSYTHLDVYKRQTIYTSIHFIIIILSV